MQIHVAKSTQGHPPRRFHFERACEHLDGVEADRIRAFDASPEQLDTFALIGITACTTCSEWSLQKRLTHLRNEVAGWPRDLDDPIVKFVAALDRILDAES